MLLALLLAPSAPAQRSFGGKLKNFSIPPDFYPPPHQSQMKSLLRGAEAQSVAADEILLHGANLETYREDGTVELIITSPVCQYNTTRRSVSSAGDLHVRTPDGRFAMEGLGWLWQQTNSSLFLSNNVKTFLQGSAADLQRATEPNGRPPVLSAKSESATNGSPILIQSDSFHYLSSSGVGTYSGNVRATGTNLFLKSAILNVLIPSNERKLQTITAEQDVSLQYQNVAGSGQTATYDTGTGLLILTGEPAWRALPERSKAGREPSVAGEGRGDQLILDRSNRVFKTIGRAWFRMPGQSLGSLSPLPAGTTTKPRPAKTNEVIEIWCDHYEFRTNFAVFQKSVVLKQFADAETEAELHCNELYAFFLGSNQVDRIEARGNVTITQAERRLTGSTAIYTATNGILELQGDPQWFAGPRSGKGDVILLESSKRAMAVRGNAVMLLPAGELAAAALPGTRASTNSVPSRTNSIARLTAEEYNINEKTVVLSGKVRIEHPQMLWECEDLAVDLPPEGAKVDHLVAEKSVKFDFIDSKGQRLRGQAGKAVYNFSVTPTATNDLVELTGSPVLETTNGTIRNEIILLDRANGKLIAPGTYKMRGSMPGETNFFKIPRIK